MIDLPRESILHFIKGTVDDFQLGPVYFSEAIAINTDLGLHGDDAYAFLEKIQKQFGTDLYMLDWQAYFYSETEGPGLLQNAPWPNNKKIPITIGHLADVIQKGVWFAPKESP